MERIEFLEQRRRSLGASDLPKILGFAPEGYGRGWRVYAEKVHGYSQPGSKEMADGLSMEPLIAAMFRQKTSLGATRPGLPIYWHRDCPWLHASPDFLTLAGQPVECKRMSDFEGWGETGSDEVPDWVAVQVHQQIGVLDVDCGYVGALFGTHELDMVKLDLDAPLPSALVLTGYRDFRWYRIPRSDRVLSRLIQVGRDFWGRVEARDEPAPDWSDPRAMEIWDCLHPPRPEVAVDLGTDATNLVNVLEVHKAHKAAAEGLIEDVKAELAQMMGDASTGRLPDGRTVVRQVIRRGEYTVNATEYVTLSVRQPRKGK